ncbi:MAG: biotin transporter BioY [Spirochaetia bacterium]
MENQEAKIKKIVATALLISLIIAGSYIAFPIPVSPVPIVLQNFFILLTGLILGPIWGVGAVSIYLLLGTLGLPIFSSGGAGIEHLFGPGGGFLFGYLLSVFITGIIYTMTNKGIFPALIASAAGTFVLYICGVPWLKFSLGITWQRALAAGMVPYLIGDALKVAAAGTIAPKLLSVIKLERSS